LQLMLKALQALTPATQGAALLRVSPLYGTQKLAKTKLAARQPKLLTDPHFSYNIDLLRRVLAFPLFASLIRDQKAAAGTARGPSGRLPPDGPASAPPTSAIPTS